MSFSFSQFIQKWCADTKIENHLLKFIKCDLERHKRTFIATLNVPLKRSKVIKKQATSAFLNTRQTTNDISKLKKQKTNNQAIKNEIWWNKWRFFHYIFMCVSFWHSTKPIIFQKHRSKMKRVQRRGMLVGLIARQIKLGARNTRKIIKHFLSLIIWKLSLAKMTWEIKTEWMKRKYRFYEVDKVLSERRRNRQAS